MTQILLTSISSRKNCRGGSVRVADVRSLYETALTNLLQGPDGRRVRRKELSDVVDALQQAGLLTPSLFQQILGAAIEPSSSGVSSNKNPISVIDGVDYILTRVIKNLAGVTSTTVTNWLNEARCSVGWQQAHAQSYC